MTKTKSKHNQNESSSKLKEELTMPPSAKDNNNNNNNNNLDIKHISKWNVETTIKWLKTTGYDSCEQSFRDHKINGRALLMLDEEDLKEVIKHNVGQRKNLYHLIKVLQITYNRYCNNLSSASSFFSNSSSKTSTDDEDENEQKHEDDDIKNDSINDQANYEDDGHKETNVKDSLTHRHLINETMKQIKINNTFDCENMFSGLKSPHSHKNGSAIITDSQNDETNMTNFCENCLKKFDHSPYTNYSQNPNMPLRSYKGEKRKTLVSIIYLFLTCLWTSFMLTVVHDRVPDMEKYPPLPDLILDNVPLIPWAFFATELIGLALLILFLLILVFHKYRIIIFRRMCSLGGTIFFLRSITMLITSLSVPGIHIQCSSQRYGSLMNKLYGAWHILSGVGLYVQGVRTCGDYMFSGHTVWLTLLTHFISEYTPLSMHWLHTMSWIANIFGLFFILGAHEHYSIDVFVGFYITSRLFLYYHSLANSKVLFQRDHKRVKIWFPLFSYFESNIHSMVPNEYEYPPNLFKYAYKFVKNKIKKILHGSNSNGNVNKSISNGPSNGNNSKKVKESKAS